MSWWLTETGAPDPAQVAPGPLPDGADIFAATLDSQAVTDLSTSEMIARHEAMAERRRLIEQATGQSYDAALAPYRTMSDRRAARVGRRGFDEERAIARLAETLPIEQRGQIHTGARLDVRAREMALEKKFAADQVLARAHGPGAMAMQVAGAVAGSFRDPAILATLPLGAARGAGILGTALTEALVAGGTEVALQPQKQKWRAELGLDTGLDVASREVAEATVFGGAVGGAIKTGEVGLRKLVEAHDAVLPDAGPDVRAARDLADDAAAQGERNPFVDDDELPDDADVQPPTAHDTHAELETAVADFLADEDAPAPDIDQNPPDDMPQIGDNAAGDPASPPRLGWPEQGIEDATPPDAGDVATASGRKYLFRPGDIKIDPKRFQFKSAINDQGVTDRFAGVTQWDADAAGTLTLWQDQAGRFYVADGHHRLELAKRLNRDGDIRIEGRVYREADGYADTDVRTIAAIVNIRQETGTELDAAKVFRDRPDFMDGLGLDPRRQHTRTAMGLARLSDDAFLMVINDRVSARYAALVGELAPDRPALHAQMLDAMAKADPDNVDEARSMVRDMLSAPSVTETTTDLFGSLESENLLLKERAQLRGAVMASLRKDRAVFGRLVDEQTRIEGEGQNQLDSAANRARRDDSAAALATLDRLANRKGPVADALNQGAQDLRAGGSKREIAGRIRSAIDQALDGADRGSRPDRGGRRGTEGGADGGPADADRPQPADAPDLEPLTDDSGPVADPDPALSDPQSRLVADEVQALRNDADAMLERLPDDLRLEDGGPTLRDEIAALDDDLDFADQLGLCLK